MGFFDNTETRSRYYGDFRGVDFSNDHTQVHEQRLAYCVNMYRDYQSGQGKALETIPGFRRRVELPCGGEVFGIHHFKKGGKDHVLIHAGSKLYRWHNYPASLNVTEEKVLTLPAPTESVFEIKFDGLAQVTGVFTVIGKAVTFEFDQDTQLLTLSHDGLQEGDNVRVQGKVGLLAEDDALRSDMNERKSTSFVFYDRLYLVDGKNYLVFDGEKIADVCENAYVPTTYIGIIPSGENADSGSEHEQRNLLSPDFKHTFVGDGSTTEFYMNEQDLERIQSVRVYGEEVTDYGMDLARGIVTLETAPNTPEEAGYPQGHAGVEITAKKRVRRISGTDVSYENVGEMIKRCTLAACFDGRVFLSGNPDLPNHVFYCERHDGYADPAYFGILDMQLDGVGNTPITGMVPVAGTLMVLKADTQQDGAIYFHTPSETGEDLQPKIYPPEQGLAGIGCLGACINFLDDPVFISRLGVEGVGQLSVRYERAIEHRSSLVDALLVNLDLQNAVMEEWNGYLFVLADGKIFMADSRQKYTHEIGTPQYEWYYLEGIGVYKGQYPAYRYAKEMPEGVPKVTGYKCCTNCGLTQSACKCKDGEKNWIDIPFRVADRVYDEESGSYCDLRGTLVNAPDQYGRESVYMSYRYTNYGVLHFLLRKRSAEEGGGLEALLCESAGYAIGGKEKPARVLKSMDENLFFGTENGVVCSFNFDLRDENGELPFYAYDFDGRTIFSGCATRMDNCGIPHLVKNTVKKSTVVKTKAFLSSAAKIKVRTNKRPYEQIARINSSSFSFDNVNFEDLSFLPEGQNLFAVREKEKQWMEKQYFVYSDEYRRPFALYYIAYRYVVAGRYKG